MLPFNKNHTHILLYMFSPALLYCLHFMYLSYTFSFFCFEQRKHTHIYIWTPVYIFILFYMLPPQEKKTHPLMCILLVRLIKKTNMFFSSVAAFCISNTTFFNRKLKRNTRVKRDRCCTNFPSSWLFFKNFSFYFKETINPKTNKRTKKQKNPPKNEQKQFLGLSSQP